MRRTFLRGAALTAAVAALPDAAPAQGTAAPAGAPMAGPAPGKAPITLSDFGSFHVGGRDFVISGQPAREVLFSPGGQPARVDPNGTYVIGGMYAGYMIPSPQRGRFPLLMWHGGGLTGVTWETTPDGREGWQHFFLRRGWPVYVSDATERGRSGWTMIPEATGGQPVFLTENNPWERFRIGDGPGSLARGTTLPGNQFPADKDSYRNFMRQNVPRFTTTDELTLESYGALLDRVGPSVVLVHSQGGFFGWRAAQERPDKVRALVLVEPAATGDMAKAAALKDVPMLVLYGDYIDGDARWPTIRANGVRFAEAIRAAGGSVDVVNLPERGIRGNSHMIMMDRNSDQVAALVQDWLVAKGLWA
ncbi:alpha/beta fold hydrolase [Roseomonas populi]|uniref:Alpha/beta fold hydrolase n=1 Tax=Roseomonas populi TaxID=3121582 RepID=A0ABT1X3T9_9PROT|nr:alpha/beta fold hydrolase [Roseomonas pecuniae]MCR0982374.1 alpha/beta fold hydrolase [Roseomonas pecuniae]